MTARDFTPTDEQLEALAKGEVGDDDWAATPEPAKVILRKWAREDLARPAFQSIVAAVKAEALRDLADEGSLAQRDGVSSPWMVAEWLNAEADRIEASA